MKQEKCEKCEAREDIKLSAEELIAAYGPNAVTKLGNFLSQKEKKEHPGFKDEQIQQIVMDHLKELGIEECEECAAKESAGVDEKKKPPICPKCKKAHWPFQKCSAKEPGVKEDVCKLESPEEDEAADYLGDISQKALEGDKKAQRFLEKIFDEKWGSIKPKLETEGSVYYVWWMDGVRKLLSKLATEGKEFCKEKESKSLKERELSDGEKLDIALDLLNDEQLEDFKEECREEEQYEPPKLGMKPLADEGKEPAETDPEDVKIKKLTEQGEGELKGVYEVLYTTKDGKAKSTRIMAFDATDAKKQLLRNASVKSVSDVSKVAENNPCKESNGIKEVNNMMDEFILNDEIQLDIDMALDEGTTSDEINAILEAKKDIPQMMEDAYTCAVCGSTFSKEEAIELKYTCPLDGGELQEPGTHGYFEEKKDLAPKKPKKGAAIRHRGDCVFPANSPKVKDNADHFPINKESQARNAWARANQYSAAPEWYSGNLSALVAAVKRAVKAKYPKIKLGKGTKESIMKSQEMDPAVLKAQELLGILPESKVEDKPIKEGDVVQIVRHDTFECLVEEAVVKFVDENKGIEITGETIPENQKWYSTNKHIIIQL